MVECEVIKWISEGVKPKMSEEELDKVKDDISKINFDRQIELDLSKSFEDHFKIPEIPRRPNRGHILSSSDDSVFSTSSGSSQEPEIVSEWDRIEANFLKNNPGTITFSQHQKNIRKKLLI